MSAGEGRPPPAPAAAAMPGATTVLELARPRMYVDTSVIGGCLDPEYRERSTRLMERFRLGKSILVLSDLTAAELAQAPPAVRDVLAGIPDASLELILQTAESMALAEEYLRQQVVPARMLIDAAHIAVATVYRADVVVSWNFRHIVNLRRIRAFNAVNLRAGYPALEIRSPLELATDDD